MAETKLNADLIATLTVYLSKGATRAEAANICGIHPSTLYHWIEQGRKQKNSLKAELATAVDKADGLVQYKLSGIIYRAAQRGDTKAAQWRKTQGQALDSYYETRKLEAEEIKERIQGHKIENRRKEAEAHYRELMNTGIEAQQRAGNEPTDFTKNSIEMQKHETTMEEVEKYYDLPSPQEDEAEYDALERQQEAEERKRKVDRGEQLSDLTDEELEEMRRSEMRDKPKEDETETLSDTETEAQE